MTAGPELKTEHLLLDAYRGGDKEVVGRILREADVFKAVCDSNQSHVHRLLGHMENPELPQFAAHWMSRLSADGGPVGCVKACYYLSPRVELVYFVAKEHHK